MPHASVSPPPAVPPPSKEGGDSTQPPGCGHERNHSMEAWSLRKQELKIQLEAPRTSEAPLRAHRDPPNRGRCCPTIQPCRTQGLWAARGLLHSSWRGPNSELHAWGQGLWGGPSMLLPLFQPEQLNPQASGPPGNPLVALLGLLPGILAAQGVKNSL